MRVASAANQAEAEFIQALLLEEGVRSTTRRSAGFDVPDFLAAGPRDILVAQEALAIARDVLYQSDLDAAVAQPAAIVQPWKLAAGLGVGLIILVVIVLVFV